MVNTVVAQRPERSADRTQLILRASHAREDYRDREIFVRRKNLASTLHDASATS
jgi:hypothetical protein